MEKDLFSWIGSLPLQDIAAPLLLHTLRQTAGQVFRYGIVTGRCERTRHRTCMAHSSPLTSSTCLPASASDSAQAQASEVVPTPPLPVKKRKRGGSFSNDSVAAGGGLFLSFMRGVCPVEPRRVSCSRIPSSSTRRGLLRRQGRANAMPR